MKRRNFRAIPENLCVALLLSGLVSISSPVSARGASFDCKKNHTFIEQAICSDMRLSVQDDRLAEAYQRALDGALAPDTLREEQRNWLATVRNACHDSSCLKGVYDQRLDSLTAIADSQNSRRNKELCAFSGLTLPENYAVVAAGGYSGRALDFQIDQSGHQATQMDVAVNYSSKPVVLMLGAYEPTIWNISWSPATRITAVLVSGYHRQAVSGLDPSVPTLNTSYDNRSPCGYFDVGENNNGKLNPMSLRLFGRPVDLVYPAKNGQIVIGNALPEGLKLITSESIPPESFHVKTAPLAGSTGKLSAAETRRPSVDEKVTVTNLAGEFVAVPGGCFSANKKQVCLDTFGIGTYDVTQGQWVAVMGNNPSGSDFKKCGSNCPVSNVSWNDVQEFIYRLNSRSGKHFRLPSEAEWEYACRSGGKDEEYCGGNNVEAVAWYYGNSVNRPHPVGLKQPNGLGIYDMSGNVRQWVSDWFDYKDYPSSRCNPTGPSAGSERVIRGGTVLVPRGQHNVPTIRPIISATMRVFGLLLQHRG